MRALIIVDQPLIVSGLQAVIGSFHAPIAVSCAESADPARQMLASDQRFDLVLLDLELEGLEGLDFLGELHNAHPALPIVVLSASNANELVSRAIFMGAMGFVFKRASNAMLVEALHLVMSGVVYVPPMKLRSQLAPGSGASARNDCGGACPHIQPAGNLSATRRVASARGLTPRQADVLEFLLLGQSNKAIARALNLSIDTVKDHVTSLMRTLDVTSRTQAVLAMGRLLDNSRHVAHAVPVRSLGKGFGHEDRALAS